MGEPEPRQEVPDRSHNQSRPVWWELGSPRQGGKGDKISSIFSLRPALQPPPGMRPSRVRPLWEKQNKAVQSEADALGQTFCAAVSSPPVLFPLQQLESNHRIKYLHNYWFNFFFFFASTTSPALQTLSSMKAGLESALLAVVTEYPPWSVIPS